MGAQFNVACVPKEISDKGPAAMRQWGNQVIEQALYDHGHSGYSGSFAEAQGVQVRRDLEGVFPNEASASAWLEDNAEKWGPIVIVPYRYGDNVLWIGGCWCSS
jgi:hypothetical protein